MLAIINAELVMRDHFIPDAYIFIQNGVIYDFGKMQEIASLDGYEVLDVNGAYVGPGLIDIHTHAGAGHLFYDEPLAAAKGLLKLGTTTVLPALYFKWDKENLLRIMTRVQEAMMEPDGENIGGIYMEGPYMNPKFGANRNNNPWRGPICREDYEELLSQGGKDVCVWALAPEREGIEQFVMDAKAVNPDVRFAVAHSEATPQQIEELIPHGLCIGTHHTNATGSLPKYPECRGVCVDEAVNYNKDIYAELICDTRGIHVDPYMLRLVRRIKGDDRIILISDAGVSNAPVPEGYEDATDIIFDATGEISGTKLVLSQSCRNMMKHTGASLVDVFNYASRNPARAVGFTDRGEIHRGLKADLVVVDHKMNVKKVIFRGKVQA